MNGSAAEFDLVGCGSVQFCSCCDGVGGYIRVGDDHSSYFFITETLVYFCSCITSLLYLSICTSSLTASF